MPEAKGIPPTLVDDFISTEAQLHNVLTDRRLRPKPPLSKTVVTRAAVETPHPGVSYNPTLKVSFDDLFSISVIWILIIRFVFISHILKILRE